MTDFTDGYEGFGPEDKDNHFVYAALEGENRALKAVIRKIAYILTNVKPEAQVAEIQQLIDWWALWEAGALHVDDLTTRIKDALEEK